MLPADNEAIISIDPHTHALVADFSAEAFASTYDPKQAVDVDKTHESVDAPLPAEPDKIVLEERLAQMGKRMQLSEANMAYVKVLFGVRLLPHARHVTTCDGWGACLLACLQVLRAVWYPCACLLLLVVCAPATVPGHSPRAHAVLAPSKCSQTLQCAPLPSFASHAPC